MTAQERSFEKGRFLGKMRGVAKQQRHDYFGGSIEILDIVHHNDFTVELFARAWDSDGRQIGFGVAGSVDAERFLIHNPPAIISDPLGEISKNRFTLDPLTQKEKFTGVDVYRLDPEKAILEALSHIIKVKKQKFGPDAIETGKVGSTTLVFHPDADPESTTVDGGVFIIGDIFVSWNAAIARIDGTGESSDDSVNNIVVNSINRFSGGAVIILTRSYFLFDTSSILPETEIVSATLSIHSTGSGLNGDQVLFAANLILLSSNPQSNTNLVLSDYDRTRFGNTILAPILSIETFNASIAYHDFPLNADGLSNIITGVGGISKFGFRGQSDFDGDSEPPFTLQSNANGYFADQIGSTQDPRLVIETLDVENALFYGGGF